MFSSKSSSSDEDLDNFQHDKVSWVNACLPLLILKFYEKVDRSK